MTTRGEYVSDAQSKPVGTLELCDICAEILTIII